MGTGSADPGSWGHRPAGKIPIVAAAIDLDKANQHQHRVTVERATYSRAMSTSGPDTLPGVPVDDDGSTPTPVGAKAFDQPMPAFAMAVQQTEEAFEMLQKKLPF